MRQSPERWEYLSAVRLVESLRYFNPGPQAVLSVSSPSPKSKLASKPRAWLVDELMRADASLTDRRILSHLGRPKLAAMVEQARRSQRRSA